MGISKTKLALLEKQKKSFKPKKVSKRFPAHVLSFNKNFMAHELDEDIVSNIRSKYADGDKYGILDLFDPDLDPHRGTYYFDWSEQIVRDFWYGCILYHLKFLRYADLTKEYSPDSKIITPPEILDFFCSARFDEICDIEGWDANLIRCSIPRIIRKYNKPSAGYCKKIISALTKFSDWYLEGQYSSASSQLQKYSY